MLDYLESSRMLQFWYEGRGKILEPSASKNDKSATKFFFVVVIVQTPVLGSNKSAKWSLFLDPVSYTLKLKLYICTLGAYILGIS